MGVDTELAPSLGDLTFDVEPRREWTPPNPHSPNAGKLWQSSEPLRNITSTSSATVNRSFIHSKPSTRPSTDTRVYDIRRAHPPPMLTPIQKQSTASPSPNKQPTPLASPSPAPSPIASPTSETVPSGPTLAPGTDVVAENNPVPARSNHNHTTPRRSNISPTRVVCPEPSFTQLPISELPSVRGQTVTSFSPTGAPTSTSMGDAGVAEVGGGSNADGNVGCAAFSGRRPVEIRGSALMSDPSVVGGYSLAEHMSAISSQMNSSQQDPVDAYLARFQIHQRINDQFRVQQDEHFRTLQELGARIQAMTKIGSPAPGGAEQSIPGEAGGEGGAAELSSALSPSAGSSPIRQGTLAGQQPAIQQQAQHQQHQHQQPPPQPLPDHPLQPRNRFTSQPAVASTLAATPTPHTATATSPATARASGRRRPSSASSISSCPSPGRCPSVQLLKSGLTGDGTEPSFGPGAAGGLGTSGGVGVGGADAASASAATASAATHGSLRGPHPHQGAYLALPDGSFAGSPPLRSVPTAEGLLFEKYSKKSQAVDLPELQLRYIRPGIVAPREPRPLKQIPRQPAPPARALPNGIPASRLERLSARRRDRSPNRLFQQQHLLQQINHSAELLKFTGTPVSAGLATPGSASPTATFSGNGGGGTITTGLAAVGDGLFRSVSLASPGPMVPYGGGVGFHPGRLRSPGAIAASAPSASEVGGATGTLAQYLAVSTATPSGEPLLDENFYEVLQQHFRSSMHTQTHQLRAQLNVNLPLVLGALNCVNVVEPRGSSSGGSSSMGGSKTK